ncbi:N-acetylmuramoyl-L-alanine amidase family protein [Komagataeibacter rhaeticus]|uniref:N-acetylmuramoyl-L-alanine amidase n=1 Tax=Komagataeibacter rhaeticus TaxID=215221 RepID=A0A181C7P6_9PROT|nr:N-acetylmuramoyl-L-alanine amidase [Komagataeibacter rhaeticus]ATU73619.1 N-acetylmuramoyl-L-alanine amidase [Komagataeibacter xylinus]QIP34549.1 N-acetylmuramoyl-L-alanine amidase [Komagataeibacter rhaeticus]QOC47067.1 N-acetylmuramoyl-L-alanine amidase [Komagataeibacter rhaeticus]WPP20599.1 N-acetylmuramoyl-L-alanine amidase [Komagataeibacter rhaeticus]SAY47601.1 N-acetylmuramoyl-L-alanine amidase AmiA precursor [Komagataeibacter rhaeticus]
MPPSRPDGNDVVPAGRGPGRRTVLGGLGLLVPATGMARTPAHPAAHAAVAHHATAHAAHPVLHAPAIVGRAAQPRPLIILDPGHGGKDPGAIGVSGTYEKHVAEAAASELQRQLEASGRYRVAMTRADDRFIPLEGRVDIAHSHKAALFISMHADALVDRGVRGASVYTLAAKASDRQTAMLARTENSADRFGGPQVHADSPEVQEILASLVTEETRHGAAHMASSIVSSFRPRIGLLPHPARHASFVVLKSADIPSVLVEMGFMSNHMDEAALRQAAHRMVVAGAMVQAIDRYFATDSMVTHATG